MKADYRCIMTPPVRYPLTVSLWCVIPGGETVMESIGAERAASALRRNGWHVLKDRKETLWINFSR